MIGFGWMNIYSANIMEADGGVFDFSQRFGKQLIWIGASILLATSYAGARCQILYLLLLPSLHSPAGSPAGRSVIRNRNQWCQKLVCYRRIPTSTLPNLPNQLRPWPWPTCLPLTNYNMKKFWNLVKAFALICSPPCTDYSSTRPGIRPGLLRFHPRPVQGGLFGQCHDDAGCPGTPVFCYPAFG